MLCHKVVIVACIILTFAIKVYGKNCQKQWDSYCGQDHSFKCFENNKGKLTKKCRQRYLLDPSLKGNEKGCLHLYMKSCAKTSEQIKCLNKNKNMFSNECHDALVQTFTQASSMVKGLHDGCGALFKKHCNMKRDLPSKERSAQFLKCIRFKKQKFSGKCQKAIEALMP